MSVDGAAREIERGSEQPATLRPIKSNPRKRWLHPILRTSPKFYHKLSTIWLTGRAKRELDRRNDNNPPLKSTAQPARRYRGAKITVVGGFGGSNLALFATDGGPDLADL